MRKQISFGLDNSTIVLIWEKYGKRTYRRQFELCQVHARMAEFLKDAPYTKGRTQSCLPLG